jgi:hypothetical protein
MMDILIGSRALNYWIPTHEISPDTDWDIITTKKIDGAECHDPYLLNNDDVYRYTTPEDTIIFNGEVLHVVSLKGLSLIKRSHLHRDLGFQKHITHFHRYLYSQKYGYTQDDFDFLATRKEMTIERFPQPQPNLNQSVDTFFVDAVVKKYKHDYLHELFAFEDAPLYTKLQRDPSSAWCHKDLWDELSVYQKIYCCAEEVYVIAAERFLIPNDWQFQTKLAYMKALQKVCTTLCSGWFRDFALDNYPTIIEIYDKQKFTDVRRTLIGL